MRKKGWWDKCRKGLEDLGDEMVFSRGALEVLRDGLCRVNQSISSVAYGFPSYRGLHLLFWRRAAPPA